MNRWSGANVERYDDGEPRWAWALVLVAALVAVVVFLGGLLVEDFPAEAGKNETHSERN